MKTENWPGIRVFTITITLKEQDPVKRTQPYTFLDGSTITGHGIGVIQATSAGVPTAAKWTSELTHGTGRFQGIKGTVKSSTKLLPPEKDEPTGKAFSEGTMVYTLPSK